MKEIPMNTILKRGANALAIAALVAAGISPALATDWGKLKGSGWSETQSTAGDQQMAATNPAGAAPGAGIAAAFTELGMTQARAECFGTTIAGQLSADQEAEAAELVRSAGESREVREKVMNAGPSMVGAFSAANETCPESMGG